MTIERVALGLMAFGGLFAFLNWVMVYQTWRTGRFHSAIPLIGGACLGGGMLLLPATRPCAWLAIILDYGTLVFLLALPHIAKELWETSWFNLLEEYAGGAGKQTIRLRLFRGGNFLINHQFRLQPGEFGLLSAGTVGSWKREEGRLVLSLNAEDSAVFEAVPGAEGEVIQQTTGFRAFEGDPRSLAGVPLKLVSRKAAS